MHKVIYLVIAVMIFNCAGRMETAANSELTNKPMTKSVLRHVVLFQFKDESSATDVQKVEQAFYQLPNSISQIKAFEWGLNNSPENLNKGFTHAFVLTFDSEKDRDDYLVHPDHKTFGEVLGPHLKDVLVVDYWQK